MGNPLACRIALASLELLLSQDWQNQVNQISTHLTQAFESLKQYQEVKDVRVLGAIGVIELKRNDLSYAIQQAAIQNGIWLRPFGRLVYTMPAYNISAENLQALSQGISKAVSQVLSNQPSGETALTDQFV